MVMTLKKDLDAQGEPLTWIQLINQCIMNLDSLERDLKEVGKQLRYVRDIFNTFFCTYADLLPAENTRKKNRLINNASRESRSKCPAASKPVAVGSLVLFA